MFVARGQLTALFDSSASTHNLSYSITNVPGMDYISRHLRSERCLNFLGHFCTVDCSSPRLAFGIRLTPVCQCRHRHQTVVVSDAAIKVSRLVDYFPSFEASLTRIS